ncbi:MAG TPA: metal ABC transporter substrate-binding protein [Candidatus Paceibacterota bacterium]|nr:metal ABC transporter substrate-binding protein [Candidatus Paceibacterota bacterium]
MKILHIPFRDIILFVIIFILVGLFFVLKNSPFKEDDEYSVIESSSIPRLKVATSLPLAAEWISKVGGTRVDVMVMPFYAEDDIRQWLGSSKSSRDKKALFLSIGNGFDDWTDSITQKFPEISVVSMNQFVTSSIPISNIIDSNDSFEGVQFYYWLSLDNARRVVQAIAREFGGIDVGNKEYFINNAYEYSIQIDTLLQGSLSVISSSKRTPIIIAKPQLLPFVQSLKLDINGGFDIEKESYPDKVLSKIRSFCRNNGIKVIIATREFDSSSYAKVIKDAGLFIVPIDWWAQGEGYMDVMRANISQILRRL